jgi:hypothetical protein
MIPSTTTELDPSRLIILSNLLVKPRQLQTSFALGQVNNICLIYPHSFTYIRGNLPDSLYDDLPGHHGMES